MECRAQATKTSPRTTSASPAEATSGGQKRLVATWIDASNAQAPSSRR